MKVQVKKAFKRHSLFSLKCVASASALQPLTLLPPFFSKNISTTRSGSTKCSKIFKFMVFRLLENAFASQILNLDIFTRVTSSNLKQFPSGFSNLILLSLNKSFLNKGFIQLYSILPVFAGRKSDKNMKDKYGEFESGRKVMNSKRRYFCPTHSFMDTGLKWIER